MNKYKMISICSLTIACVLMLSILLPNKTGANDKESLELNMHYENSQVTANIIVNSEIYTGVVCKYIMIDDVYKSDNLLAQTRDGGTTINLDKSEDDKYEAIIPNVTKRYVVIYVSIGNCSLCDYIDCQQGQKDSNNQTENKSDVNNNESTEAKDSNNKNGTDNQQEENKTEQNKQEEPVNQNKEENKQEQPTNQDKAENKQEQPTNQDKEENKQEQPTNQDKAEDKQEQPANQDKVENKQEQPANQDKAENKQEQQNNNKHTESNSENKNGQPTKSEKEDEKIVVDNKTETSTDFQAIEDTKNSNNNINSNNKNSQTNSSNKKIANTNVVDKDLVGENTKQNTNKNTTPINIGDKDLIDTSNFQEIEKNVSTSTADGNMPQTGEDDFIKILGIMVFSFISIVSFYKYKTTK